MCEFANSHLYFGSWTKIQYMSKDGKKIIDEKMWDSNRWTYANGGSITVKRKFFISIGGYDNIYRGWGAEDNDFNFRASVVMGYPAQSVKGVTLKHKWHTSKSLPNSNYIRLSNNNILYFRIKNNLSLLNRYAD